MRLFVALLPPPEAAAELRQEIAALKRLPGADDLGWTEEAGWHFTLAFLGQVADDVLPDLEERLRRAARRHTGPRLRLTGGGRFGDRVLWAGADGDKPTLRRLAASAAAAGRRAGIDLDTHPFKAHLTLARSRTVRRSPQHPAGRGTATVDLRPFAEALASFEGSQWTADTLRLMSSTSGGAGRPNHYDTVRSWPLRPAARQPGDDR